MTENINPINRNPNDKLLSLQKSLRIESEKLDVLSSQVHLMQQQLDLYQHEEKIAKDKIKKALDDFTKDMCQSLVKLKKPSDEVKGICDIFLLFLNIKERSWPIFKEVGKNYIGLKTLMTGLKLEGLSNSSIESALPLWKNYNLLSASIKKNYKGASIILDWITSVVEWRLKNETMKSLELRFPDFQKQVLNQLNLIAQLKAHIIEQEQSRSKLSQGSFAENNRSQGRLEYKISSPIAKKTGDLEDLMTAHKSPVNNDPFKLREENLILHTETTNATQKLTMRRPFQTDPNTYTQRIAEEDISDSSIFFDLDINSSEKMTGFRDVLKPKPKVLPNQHRETAAIKNSMIIMNNLQLIPDGLGLKETFVEDHLANNQPNKDNLEDYNKEIKEIMKVTLSPSNQNRENPSNLKRIQEINNDYRRPNMIESQNETIICCGKSFHNRFFCA